MIWLQVGLQLTANSKLLFVLCDQQPETERYLFYYHRIPRKAENVHKREAGTSEFLMDDNSKMVFISFLIHKCCSTLKFLGGNVFYNCMCSDVYKIQEGIGDKAGMLVQAFTTFVTSMVIGFTKGWKLTLVILAVSPALGISAALFSKVTSRRLCASFRLSLAIHMF